MQMLLHFANCLLIHPALEKQKVPRSIISLQNTFSLGLMERVNVSIVHTSNFCSSGASSFPLKYNLQVFSSSFSNPSVAAYC